MSAVLLARTLPRVAHCDASRPGNGMLKHLNVQPFTAAAPCFHRAPPSRHTRTVVAVALDQAPAWTLDQVAGLAFGGVLLAFYLSSQEIDKFVARSQRRQLGLCERCGGLNEASTCQEKSCPMRTGQK